MSCGYQWEKEADLDDDQCSGTHECIYAEDDCDTHECACGEQHDEFV